jgi:hypothetical protein
MFKNNQRMLETIELGKKIKTLDGEKKKSGQDYDAKINPLNCKFIINLTLEAREQGWVPSGKRTFKGSSTIARRIQDHVIESAKWSEKKTRTTWEPAPKLAIHEEFSTCQTKADFEKKFMELGLNSRNGVIAFLVKDPEVQARFNALKSLHRSEQAIAAMPKGSKAATAKSDKLFEQYLAGLEAQEQDKAVKAQALKAA